MADLSSLDELLSSSIKSAAEPAASAGVADAIRSRLAAGDAGTTVDGPTAPGWMPPRPRWLVPLVAGVGGLAVIAAILIVMLVVGTAVTPEATPEPTVGTPTPTVTPTPTATPSPTPTPTTDPAPPPPPPPPRDQTAPTITAGQWSPGAVWGQPTPCGGTTSDIVMSFADNVGVTAVSTATSLAGTTVTLVSSSPSGSVYRFTGTTVSTDAPVTVTFTARDAAGNTSNVATSLVNAGTCIT